MGGRVEGGHLHWLEGGTAAQELSFTFQFGLFCFTLNPSCLSHPDHIPGAPPPSEAAIFSSVAPTSDARPAGTAAPASSPTSAPLPSSPAPPADAQAAPGVATGTGVLTQLQSETSDSADDIQVRVWRKGHPKAAFELRSAPHPFSLRQTFSPTRTQPIDQDMLKKYILYARTYCKPKLLELDQDKIVGLYTTVRQEAMVGACGMHHRMVVRPA